MIEIIKELIALEMLEILEERKKKSNEKKGLWYYIRARREAGKPRLKPGDEGYPKTLDVGKKSKK